MKKLCSLFLALALTCSLAVPAIAAENNAAPDVAPITAVTPVPVAPAVPDAAVDKLPPPTPEQIAAQINAELTALGGVPGQLNVRLNDKCVAFPDAAPEVLNNRTMVPIRAIMEALGATVKYLDDGTVSILRGDVTMAFKLGEKQLTTTGKDGKAVVTEMDAAPYAKSNRSYVPLRFLSEACGLTVLWDQNYQTAVVLDKTDIVAGMDRNFSILNKLMKAQMEKTPKRLQGEMKFTAKLDVLSPQKVSYSIPGTVKTDSAGTTMRMDMTADGSALLPLIDQMVAAQKAAATDDAAAAQLAVLAGMKPLIKDFKLSLMVVADGGYYVYLPLANYYLKSMGLGVDESTWLKLMEMGGMMEELADSASMGSVLYSSLMSTVTSMEGVAPNFMAYDMIKQSGDLCTLLMGDKTFTQKGSSYQWELKLDGLLQSLGMPQTAVDETKKVLKDMSFTMTQNLDGSYTMKGGMQFMIDEAKKQVLDLSIDSSGNLKKDSMSLLLKLTDLFHFELKGSSTYTEPATLPEIALPKDATVFDLMSLMAGGM